MFRLVWVLTTNHFYLFRINPHDCFVKYNVYELAKLVVQSYLDDLHDSQGYPKEIKDFKYDKHLSKMLNNAVWDIENGTTEIHFCDKFKVF